MVDPAIKVEHLSKQFRLPHEKYWSLKQKMINIFRNRTYTKLQALKDVSLEVKPGEFFGIIGRNGSGKSTLLKILAGIYIPTSGRTHVRGSLSPFIELGVGFHPELTARENTYLNGAILGLNRRQINDKFEEIIKFSELEEFLDQRLKNFSSGMQVRLAFSIATQASSDVLLVDEVLAVGDASFQKKCLSLFRKFKKEGRTIVFVSHDTDIMKEFCDRIALIENGEVVKVGKPTEVLDRYAKLLAGK